MKKAKIVLSVILIVALTVGISDFVVYKFDNTSVNTVSKEKTNVTVLIDENASSSSNVIDAEIVIENCNDFDINMFGVSYQDRDLSFNISSEGVFTIEKDDTLEYKFSIEFDESIKSEEYLSLLQNKNILISFNADAANQNDNIIQIKPEIELKAERKIAKV